MENTFTCCDCGEAIALPPKGATGGTGYALDRDNGKVCYACCGKRDAEAMRTDGKAYLYFTGDKVTNWPGTLSFPVYSKRSSWHNMAGKNGRVDFWFDAFGRHWHGVCIGRDNQCSRVNALKR